jgi:hypothetical protein
MVQWTETRLNIIKGFMLYIELIKNIMILDRIWIETLTQCVWKVVGTIKIIIIQRRFHSSQDYSFEWKDDTWIGKDVEGSGRGLI